MEKIVEIEKIKKTRKRFMQNLPRRVYLSLITLVIIALVSINLPQKAKMVLKKNFVLEKVQWEEVGSTNLSHYITKSLLWEKSRLKLKEPLLDMDLGALETHLLEIPWIESVQLQAKLPSTLLVRYTVHQARALGLKEGKLWLLSAAGKWIVPIGILNEQEVDLPVLTNAKAIESSLFWLDTLEKELSPNLLQIHEINVKNDYVQALVELQYPFQSEKVLIYTMHQTINDTLLHLKMVLQYLMKNKILISSLDLRDNEKVIVNIGKRL